MVSGRTIADEKLDKSASVSPVLTALPRGSYILRVRCSGVLGRQLSQQTARRSSYKPSPPSESDPPRSTYKQVIFSRARTLVYLLQETSRPHNRRVIKRPLLTALSPGSAVVGFPKSEFLLKQHHMSAIPLYRKSENY